MHLPLQIECINGSIMRFPKVSSGFRLKVIKVFKDFNDFFVSLASPKILRLGIIKLKFASALDFSYLCNKYR